MWRLPVGLAAATILVQVAYPLLDGTLLRGVTAVAVLCFAAASASHAIVHRGVAWGLGLVMASAGLGFAAEVVGVATGYPFGGYAYAGTLGPRVFGVPLLVSLAWVMFAYPSLVVARRLARARWVPLVFAASMTSWDVSLDPQMVSAGHWTWRFPSPALPGVPGIPLTNYAGWFLVALALGAVLDRLPRRAADDAVPLAMFLWTWLGSVVGNAVFMGRTGVAVVGGVLLGLVGVPLVVELLGEINAGGQEAAGGRHTVARPGAR